MTDNGKQHKQTEDYVNVVLMAFITPMEELKDIRCRHKGARGEAYIRLRSAYGNSFYYDVTDLSREEIGFLLASVLTKKPVKRQVTDKDKIKEVESLFD